MSTYILFLVAVDHVSCVSSCEACSIHKFSRVRVLPRSQASKYMTIGFVYEGQDMLYTLLVLNGKWCEAQQTIILHYL